MCSCRFKQSVWFTCAARKHADANRANDGVRYRSRPARAYAIRGEPCSIVGLPLQVRWESVVHLRVLHACCTISGDILKNRQMKRIHMFFYAEHAARTSSNASQHTDLSRASRTHTIYAELHRVIHKEPKPRYGCADASLHRRTVQRYRGVR